jgi:hypothetical protein
MREGVVARVLTLRLIALVVPLALFRVNLNVPGIPY